MAFSSSSSSVFLTNVDDYLAPSQACVNPLFSVPNSSSLSATTKEDEQQQPPVINHTATTTPTQQVVIPRQQRRRRRPLATTPTVHHDDNNNSTITTMQVEDYHNSDSANDWKNKIDTQPQQPQNTTTSTTTVVKATMADCLACSGCITTAETVLVEQHSASALKRLCLEHDDDNDELGSRASMVVVVTISPAAWADILRHWKVTTDNNNNAAASSSFISWQRRLVHWWHQFFHVSMVIDGNIPLQWSLTEAAREFCRAYQQQYNHNHFMEDGQQQQQQQQQYAVVSKDIGNHQHHDQPSNRSTTESSSTLDSLLPSVALSATQTQYMLPDGSTKIATHSNDDLQFRHAQLPLFTSSCPALVCLVEKSSNTISNSVLSSNAISVANLATTQSPMSIAGNLVKHVLFAPDSCQQQQQQQQESTMARHTTTRRRRVRHIAIMPCHDKKLEASRKDFLYPTTSPTTISTTSTTNALEQQQQQQHVSQAATATENHHFEPSVDLVLTTQEWWNLILETFQQQQQSPHTSHVGENQDNIVDDSRAWIQTFVMAPIMDLDEYWNHDNAAQEETSSTAVFLSKSKATVVNLNTPNQQPSLALPMVIDSEIPLDIEQSVFSKGSGGYADFVFRYAARHLFGCVITSQQLPWTPFSATSLASVSHQPILRSRRRRLADSKPNDLYELCLYRHEDGSYSCYQKHPTRDRVVLRFGMAYGLQNVQRMLQQGAGKSQQATSTSSLPVFHYVEAMACPMGCVNGGGQLRVAARETPSETRQRVAQTQQIFSKINDQVQDGLAANANETNSSNLILSIDPHATVNDLCPTTGRFGTDARLQLHTRYHVVPPLQHTQGATAGVAVSDLRW